MSQRILYLDVLRIIAIFAVIFLHVASKDFNTSFGSNNWYISMSYNALTCWGVPIFVMISGALFLDPQKIITINKIYNRYISRLLFAYIFWSFLYSALTITMVFLSTKEFHFHWQYFIPHYHLWFLPMLISVYFFVPIMRKFSTDKTILLYTLLLWFCFFSGRFILISKAPQNTVFPTLLITAGYMGYFLLGYYLSTHTIQLRKRRIIYLMGCLGLLLTICGTTWQSFSLGYGNKKFFNTLSPHVMIMSAALFVFAKNITTKYTTKLTKVVEHVQKDVFGIYLVHSIWMFVINTDSMRNLANQVITIPIITFIVFILSLYTIKVMKHIPFLCKVVE